MGKEERDEERGEGGGGLGMEEGWAPAPPEWDGVDKGIGRSVCMYEMGDRTRRGTLTDQRQRRTEAV